MSKSVRASGISPVVRAIQEFEPGAKVHVLIDPSIHKGMPHRRFQGKIGVIVNKRGGSYVVNVTQGDALKDIIVRPEHLRHYADKVVGD